jgi:hypothetical protein
MTRETVQRLTPRAIVFAASVLLLLLVTNIKPPVALAEPACIGHLDEACGEYKICGGTVPGLRVCTTMYYYWQY